MSRTATTLLVALLPVCALIAGPASAEEESETILTGEVTRERIETAVPGWVGRTVEAPIDREAAAALAAVPPGATITVYLGTWCSDSAREVPRFWRALDQIGYQGGAFAPFEIRYVGVDRAEKRPPELAEEVGLEYVPTFIVRRDGAEVGRIVESAPRGVEVDLAALLTGESEGVLSGRDDLGGPSGPVSDAGDDAGPHPDPHPAPDADPDAGAAAVR